MEHIKAENPYGNVVSGFADLKKGSWSRKTEMKQYRKT
jgi:hypothetical protein